MPLSVNKRKFNIFTYSNRTVKIAWKAKTFYVNNQSLTHSQNSLLLAADYLKYGFKYHHCAKHGYKRDARIQDSYRAESDS